MKQLLLWLLLLMLSLQPTTGFSNAALAEYEEAYKIYVTASASVAAYNDRIGQMATRYLEQDGWNISHYVQAEGKAGARFLIANKAHGAKNIYVVAIVGTENANDVKLNLNTYKVYFAGSSIEEFAANMDKPGVNDSEPKVHRGFLKYLQSALMANMHDPSDNSAVTLPDFNRLKPNDQVYITGHSLGGAAAILAGAELISMGVPSANIEVITFGAPAVGNPAFAAKYAPLLNLTRITMSGDPVTGILQTVAGSYKHFGQELKWRMPPTVADPHRLIGYHDLAIKNYYTKRAQARQSGQIVPVNALRTSDSSDKVYIAGLSNNLPSALADDFWYMQEALNDEYQQLPRVIVDAEATPLNWLERAQKLGCRWAIVPSLSAERLKSANNAYALSLTQIIYDVKADAPLDISVFTAGTYRLTPLQAFIHSLRSIVPEQIQAN